MPIGRQKSPTLWVPGISRDALTFFFFFFWRLPACSWCNDTPDNWNSPEMSRNHPCAFVRRATPFRTWDNLRLRAHRSHWSNSGRGSPPCRECLDRTWGKVVLCDRNTGSSNSLRRFCRLPCADVADLHCTPGNVVFGCSDRLAFHRQVGRSSQE